MAEAVQVAVLIVGARQVGKSNLMNRLFFQEMDHQLPNHMNLGMAWFTFHRNEGVFDLHFYDVPSSKKLDEFYITIKADIVIFCVMFDYSRPETLVTASDLLDTISTFEPRAKIRVFLVGNKNDLLKHTDQSDIDSLAEKFGIKSLECSLLDMEAVHQQGFQVFDELFSKLSSK